MTCPHCGARTATPDLQCRSCGRRADSAATNVATGLLTPLPEPENTATIILGNPDIDETCLSDAPPVGHGFGSGIGGHVAPEAGGPLSRGQQFGSRYQILKLLGAGGMGAVYQAWDSELSVPVAVKVIRPDIVAGSKAGGEIERRFKRELLLARQVTHPNVVRIHDLGEINGIKYITMPFIEGSDLATILKKETKLPVTRALKIARGIAAGLVAAHAAGVVHRDLKPANIMIGADDEPTIMDFGIARSAGGSGTVPASKSEIRPAALRSNSGLLASQTMAGAIIGTLEYMAPEQARGELVDQRADVYAFGLILYDMLVGRRRAQRAASAVAELQARMEKAPPAPRTVDHSITTGIDQIVSRCLEPDSEKRFQTTAELQASLNLLDEKGKPLPIYRRVHPRTIAAAVVLVAGLLIGTFQITRQLSAPVKAHDPVSVVIADIQNRTNDPTFDNSLPQTLRRALEGASFITAYDRSRVGGLVGGRTPEKLDETAARELAVKQGLGVVLAGAIDPRGQGYEIAIKAIQTVTGNVIADVRGVASGKDNVLETTTRLMAGVRNRLGDETTESAQLFAMRSLSTSSLEVVSHYAAAVEAQTRGKFEDARQHYLKAVELDPKFGLGYQGLAVMSRNLQRFDDADKYIKEALRYLDSMTDRERMATRGFYYRLTNDNEQCANEYGLLVKAYPADTVAHMQRGVCLARMRKMREAVAAMRYAVEILPNHIAYRGNLALAEVVAGEFEQAEKEVKSIPTPDARALQTLAYSQLGRGLVADARETYHRIGTMGAQAASAASAGLADLAAYEGRIAEAVNLYEKGAEADLAAKSPDRAAVKFVSAAYAHLVARQEAQAIAAAEKALQHSKIMPVRFLAARVLVEAGAIEKAQPLVAALEADLAMEPQVHAKILDGAIALKKGNPREAIRILTEANKIVDTWLGRFELGRAYLAAGAIPQADSEFDLCITRRGEALSLMDEGPTYAYFPQVYYYQGRVREELKTAGFADAYREYLRIRGQSTEDPLVPDVRRRVDATAAAR
jgi:serine/threonine protein kinase/tetratricopeptide (TPR) repeat protein